MNTIEKCCRAICADKEIDPDALVCPLVPQFINATPLVNGFFIPPVGTFCKAWELFEHYVRITLETIKDDPIYEDSSFKNDIEIILDEK